MVKHRSATLMALPLVATMVLSGCASGQKPTAAAAPTSSAATASASPTTGSASPTTSGPAIDPNIPAAARAKTAAGSEAFVRYYFSQFNRSWSRPQAGLLPPLSADSCRSCSAYDNTAKDMQAKGQRWQGEAFTVETVGSLGWASKTVAEVLVIGEQKPGALLDTSGRVLKRKTSAESGKFVVSLDWTGSSWRTNEIKVQR